MFHEHVQAAPVPKSMNPLWGLKPVWLVGSGWLVAGVPKSMNPLWGLKPGDMIFIRIRNSRFPKA